jgi:hypothetical protein
VPESWVALLVALSVALVPVLRFSFLHLSLLLHNRTTIEYFDLDEGQLLQIQRKVTLPLVDDTTTLCEREKHARMSRTEAETDMKGIWSLGNSSEDSTSDQEQESPHIIVELGREEEESEEAECDAKLQIVDLDDGASQHTDRTISSERRLPPINCNLSEKDNQSRYSLKLTLPTESPLCIQTNNTVRVYDIFDLGTWSNVVQVLGPQWYLWFIPIQNR